MSDTGTKYLLETIISSEMTENQTSLSPQDYFERFVPEQLLKDFDLGPAEIDAGIVDGGNDGGIDSIYIFLDDSLLLDATDVGRHTRNPELIVHIFQTKMTDGFQEAALQKLLTSMPVLFQPGVNLNELSRTYNADLLNIISIWNEVYPQIITLHPTIIFRCYYATKGSQVNPNTRRIVPLIEERMKNMYSRSSMDFRFVTAEALVNAYHSQPNTTSLLRTRKIVGAPGGAFVALTSLGDYFDFITDENGNILNRYFESNVRDYQGDIEVNRGIRNSLRDVSVDFWWLNNGVTMLVDESSLSGDDISISNPQIVNGLQTSRELYDVFVSLSETDRKSDNRLIMVRILKTRDSEVRDQIITATNSQTKIPPASLHATDPIHRKIELYFEANGLYYDRRKSYQANRGRPRDKIIAIGYLAQTVMAIRLQRPDDSRARPGNLLKEQRDYDALFDDSYPLVSYLRCVEVLRRVDAFLRTGDAVVAANEKNNVRWHLAMFAVAVRMRRKHPSMEGIADLDAGSLTDDFLGKCLAHVWKLYQDAVKSSGSPDRAAKSKDFVNQLAIEIAAINGRKVAL